MHANVACFWRSFNDSGSSCFPRSARAGPTTATSTNLCGGVAGCRGVSADQDPALGVCSTCGAICGDVPSSRGCHVHLFKDDDELM